MQLSLPPDSQWRPVIAQLSRKMLLLTTLISLPSLCWYIAVPLTGVSEITTLYASSTFWTYGFALWLLREPLSRLIISAITIAFVGVLLITYSGVEQDEKQAQSEALINRSPQLPERSSPHRILGDLIMLAGSVFLGYYEVVYKQMLPESHGGVVTAKTMDEASPSDPPLGRGSYRRISSNAGDDMPIPLRTHRSSMTRRKSVEEGHLPIALHANLLTSVIGWMTLLIFWLPIPLLDWLGLEDFAWPTGVWPWMLVICLAGATYNAGFMVSPSPLRPRSRLTLLHRS